MAFQFKKCSINGLYEIEPKIFGDNRGYFLETYSEKDFFEAGLTMKFVQDNQSKSSKYVLRGLHFQKHHPQGKLVRALEGKVYDVAVDLREGSPSFGKYYGVILDAEKQNMFYIPEGFAHGFCVLTDTATFAYKCTDFYHPEDEGGVMWNDPAFGIEWEKICPGITEKVNLSEKDKKHEKFSSESKFFDINAKWIGKQNDELGRRNEELSENVLLDKSKAFALKIIKIYKYLTDEKKEFILSKQVLRSGTSIGANAREASRSQSKADFYAKLYISLKEADETQYWLDLLYESGYLPEKEYKTIYEECEELIRLLVSITKNQKKNS